MKDKDYNLMLQYMLPICKILNIVEISMERSTNKEILQSQAKQIGYKNIEVSQSISSAISKIRLLNTPTIKTPTIICGSFYIMEEVVNNLRTHNLFDKNL